MKHRVNEGWAVCQVPAFVSTPAFLSVHLTITQAKMHAPPSSMLASCTSHLTLRFLPWESGHLVGMPNQVNTTQQACAPVASTAPHSLLACTSLPSNSPVLQKNPHPPSKFSFPKGAVVSDAVTSCWLAPDFLLVPSICKLNITDTKPIPA